jgi:hypothetical protein
MSHNTTVVLLLLALLFVQPVSALAQTAGTVTVTGRITTTGGDLLPGVTVTLSGDHETTQAVTGADGTFRIEAFLNGASPLMLSASLPGFKPASRAGIRARSGGAVNLGDIRLTVGCLAEVDFVATGLREEASRALTVARLRIESVQPVREWTIDKQCFTGSEVSAVVVDDLRGRRAESRIRFLAIKDFSKPPYEPGDDIVVALNRDAASRRYFSWGYGYPVRNGVVSLNAPFDEFEEEIPVNVLFERLKER